MKNLDINYYKLMTELADQGINHAVYSMALMQFKGHSDEYNIHGEEHDKINAIQLAKFLFDNVLYELLQNLCEKYNKNSLIHQINIWKEL